MYQSYRQQLPSLAAARLVVVVLCLRVHMLISVRILCSLNSFLNLNAAELVFLPLVSLFRKIVRRNKGNLFITHPSKRDSIVHSIVRAERSR